MQLAPLRIEHCDKANEIAEFLLDQPNHPTAVGLCKLNQVDP
jgi:hypothetical protein